MLIGVISQRGLTLLPVFWRFTVMWNKKGHWLTSLQSLIFFYKTSVFMSRDICTLISSFSINVLLTGQVIT